MIIHVEAEEALMKERPYPGSEFHFLEHAIFRERIKDFKANLDHAGPQPDLLASINQTIVDRLVNHICNEDQVIRAHFKAEGCAAEATGRGRV